MREVGCSCVGFSELCSHLHLYSYAFTHVTVDSNVLQELLLLHFHDKNHVFSGADMTMTHRQSVALIDTRGTVCDEGFLFKHVSLSAMKRRTRVNWDVTACHYYLCTTHYTLHTTPCNRKVCGQ
jgi:hypothetical protein